ncbi:MAG: M20/M25/M40 family metallo-hydrolase [Clostridia bacterium]|nr:M20/M25/M40 family metallo-hydrolase [Clostridia bacterium]
MKELLKELSLSFGPSGCEDGVREIIEKFLVANMPEGAELIKDRNGGIFLHIGKEDKPRLMVSAHMDEVGFMVTAIEENGNLRFDCVGGIDPIVLASKRVVSENGRLGSIIAKPIHLLSQEERGKKTQVKDMMIDIGAVSRKEAEELTFVGEFFTFDSDYVEYGNGFVKCKALDDRLGCAIMCMAVKEIKEKGLVLPWDLYFAFTCREEVGYSGAFGASRLIEPDYAVVIESKAVADIYGVGDRQKVCNLGEGAIISFADRGTLYDRDFTRYLMELCDKNGIKYQTHKMISGGNDSAHIQKTAGGCRVGLLSAASRYIHSPSDVVHYEDLEAIYQALICVIKEGVK